ncbi:MAG: SPOR domain-containing protein [Synergistaceae bacterium]|jgi:cell division septation protein DedD|nr:SPOR domain-containing protein [Synergistaceae bacterium]
MATTSRRSRNYKEKNSMFAFGHFALPIAALVAVGLLFVGIKLFFLTPSDRGEGFEVPIEGPIGSVSQDASAPEIADDPEPQGAEIAVIPTQTPTAAPTGPSVGPITDTPGTGAVIVTQAPRAPTSPAVPVKKTPAAPKRPTPTAQQAPSGAGWAVQVGAFSKESGANEVLNEMKKMGYAASISKSDASGATFHRVRVAAGRTREEAQRVASALEKKGYPVLVVPSR